MPRGHLGKLPSLQAIGKSTVIDYDEPPEDSFDTSEYDAFYAASAQVHDGEDPYMFELSHGKQTAEMLQNTFKAVQPGNHICKRFPDSASSFLHCRNANMVGGRYAQLRELLEVRARLQLVRDYTSRLNAAAMFVKDLEAVVREEYRVWHDICHEELVAPPVSRLECLSSICEDLRVHMNHWNSVKQLVHTEPWLLPLLPGLSLQMDAVRRKLYYLRDNCIWWIDRLIRVGLQVLAHSDLEKLGQDSLWSITRGIEDFNSIVTAIRFENAQETLSLSPSLTTLNQSQCSLLTPADAVVMNSYKNIGESIKPIPFIRVLHILANERAKYVAIMTHRIVTANDTLHILIGSNKIREYAWNETLYIDKGKPLTANGMGANTSDYHSATESYTSMGNTAFRVGDIIAPDVSRHVVPINEFSHREHEFAAKFLQIVCDSTSLLKKSSRSNSKEDAGASSRPRKTVSWGDVADNSVRSQLTHRYLELLWHYYSSHLFDFFHDLIWGGSDVVKGQLGHVILCPDTVVMVCVRMMQQVCLKDVLPLGAVSSLGSIAWRLEVSAAWAAWQSALSCALASQSSDKCNATPLVDGEVSTRTGRLFRDSFHPLRTILRLLEARGSSSESGRGANGLVVGGKGPPLTLLLPTLQRLVTTCELALSWCSNRGRHFLASWSLAQFLLVTQSDLKMLGDEMQTVAASSQRLCVTESHGNGTQVETLMQSQISLLWNQLNNCTAKMQSLSGALVKAFSEKCKSQASEFFEESMPVGKIWKKKVTQDLPNEANAYVERGLDLLLEPVVAGVSKLRTTAQLSAISMAVTALGEAWTEFILRQKIRFSVHGAYQLHQDFIFVRTWLELAIQNPEVKHSILALDIFKYLNGISELLKRQPRGRSVSRGAANQKAYVQNDDISSSRPVSGMDCASTSSNEHDSRSNGRSPDDYQVAHMEQWLALRVHGGARQWPRLPSCFTTSQP